MSRETRAPRRPPAPGVAVAADRRFRRPDGLPARRRRGIRAWAARLRWLAGLLLAVVIGGWGVSRVLASDVFLVQALTIRGNQHLSSNEVESLLAGLRGAHLLSVDFEVYRQKVLGSPWVDEVSLARVLPSTIVVDITERTPVALARLDQRLYLVDSTGNIIDEHRADHHAFDLPIVDGLLEPTADDGVTGEPGRAALVAAVLTDLSGRPNLAARLSQIDVSNARDVLVMLDDDPAWLHLGRERFEERLQRYLDLRPALQDRFGAMEYVDLKFDERVYVRGRRQRAARALDAQ